MSSPFGTGQQTWPSDPTMPSAAPAGYMTPVLPDPSHNEPAMTSAEVAARRGQFYELILQQVVKALTGFFPFLGPAFTQLENWGGWVASLFGLFPTVVPQNDGTAVPNLFAGLTDNLDGTVKLIGDSLNGLVVTVDGVVTSAANALQGALTGAIGTVGGLMNAVIGGLTGSLGQTATPNQVNIATQAAAATLAANTAAILTLQAQNSNLTNSGQAKSVDFSLYPDSQSLPAGFTQTYSGSATQNYLGVSTGRAAFNFVVDGLSTCVAVYNALQTDSDYQLIGATFATLPQIYAPEGGGASTPDSSSLWLLGRVNSSGDSYVHCKIWADHIELGCMVSGVKTTFTTQSWTAKAGSAYYLECGTAGGVRVFRVRENSTVIFTYTEVGTTSQLGASNRFCGLGGESYRLFIPQHFGFFSWWNDYYIYYLPPQLTAWAFADNTPAALLGKQARWYRANTAGSAVISFEAVTNDMFDTTDYNVGGIFTFDGPNRCRVTVSEKGLYEVTSLLNINGNVDTLAYLFKNNTTVPYKRGEREQGIQTFSVWKINLEPGDYIHVGCYVSSAVSYVGNATGDMTYLEIVKLGSV